MSLFEMRRSDLRREVPPAARYLRDLAEVIDYVGCARSMRKITDSLLYDFSMPSVRDALSFQAAVDLVAAAYMMDSARFFRLFTKRLLTDYKEGFGEAGLPPQVPFRIMHELN